MNSEKETEISTDQLLQLLKNPETILIDIRPVEAYNGWKLHGESRGGHIPGARSLPLKWFDYIDWIEIVRSKNITLESKVILYGYNSEDSDRAANLFRRSGHNQIAVYNHFLAEWVNSPDLPMEALRRYRNLVPAPWLAKVLETGIADNYNNSCHILCHVHYRNPDDYAQGHIPGAIGLDTLLLESPETWNRRSPEELKRALEKLGITHDTTVTLYGRFSFPNNDDPFPGSSAGHLGAMRCAAIMLYAGVEDVRILNGGLQAWIDQGYDLSLESSEPVPVSDFGRSIPSHPEYMVDLPQARQILLDNESNLVSVRSWKEYIGEVSGYNYIEKKGRIPGSVFGNCGSDAYHMENYRNPDHTTREYHEIEELWAAAGITPDKHNAFYCGTGWRGAEAFINAWLIGWPRISVFDGGWFEWSNDERNPIATGEPAAVSD